MKNESLICQIEAMKGEVKMTLVQSSQDQWIPIKSKEARQKIETIIKEVAQRLADPQVIYHSESIRKQHSPTSLGSGHPSLCVMYSELDRLYPTEGWDVIAHQYMVEIQKGLNSNGLSWLGMWSGFAGIGLATHCLSRDGTRYQTMQSTINNLLVSAVPDFVQKANENLGRAVKSEDFEVINGLAGLARYLLFFKDVDKVKECLRRILTYFVALSDSHLKEDRIIPNWYVPRESYLVERDRALYPNGKMNLGLSHGITGPLAFLALSIIHGVEVDGQKEAIKKIVDVLLKWKRADQYGPLWPQVVSWEEWVDGKLQRAPIPYESWCYGPPGIGRVLWLCGQALSESNWNKIAIDAFTGASKRPHHLWNIVSPTICHGFAGLLQLSQRMYSESNCIAINELRDALVYRVINHYDEDLPFGFADISYDHKKVVKNPYNIGLLEGVSGILTVLTGLLNDKAPKWDTCLLIS